MRRWFTKIPWLRCWLGEHKYVSRLVLDRDDIYRGYVCDHCGKIGRLTYKFK